MSYSDKVKQSSAKRAYVESRDRAQKHPLAYWVGFLVGLALMVAVLGGLIWVNVQIWSAIF